MLLFLISIIVNIFFALSVYKTAKLIPKQFHTFPIWFSWLFIIPMLGIIFKWMMLPFGLPQALRQYRSNDPNIIRSADKLFKLGLAYVILLSVLFLSFYGLLMAFLLAFFGVFVYIAAIVLLILYWIEITSVQKYLLAFI